MQPVTAGKKPFGGALRYSLLFVAVQLAALVLSTTIASNPWFLDHDAYATLRSNLGYSLRVGDVDCEIVLYGDSSALTALDPAVIRARTGMSACNLSELGSVHQTVTSYYPLDQYLAHHSRPKVIYTMWAAFAYHPQTKPMVAYGTEGIEYALLYDRDPRIARAVLHHPLWAVRFSIWVENRLLEDLAQRVRGMHSSEVAKAGIPRDQQAGMWRFPLPAQTKCGLMAPLDGESREQEREEIAEFKRHYESGGTQVLVNVAPVADCVANRADLRTAAEGVGDNQLQFWPVRFFNENDYHFVPEGSEIVSEEAADQILKVLRSTSGGGANAEPIPSAGVPSR